MDEAEVRRLIGLGEGQRVEFKTSFAEQNEGIESLCAFTHADGGTVIFGVKDSGQICGVQLGKNTLENFGQALRTNTEPQLYPRVHSFELDGKTVVAADIGRARDGELFHAFKTPYIRVGKTNEVMTSLEQKARLNPSAPTESEKIQLQVRPDYSLRTRPVVQTVAVLRVEALPRANIKHCYGRVARALWDNEATLGSTGWEETYTPLFVPTWENHDIFLRWTGQPSTERFHDFPNSAILEVAVDSWERGSEFAFLAAAREQAAVEYPLYANHTYLLDVEVGAENAPGVTRRFRLSLQSSHLKAGVLGQRRLEIEEDLISDQLLL